MKTFLTLAGLMMFYVINGQISCSCTNNMKNHNETIITNASIEGGEYLLFKCVNVIRIYYNNEQGYEVEKNKLQCISENKIKIKLSSNFTFCNTKTQNSSTKRKLQKKYQPLIKLDKFYSVDFNKNREITTICEYNSI